MSGAADWRVCSSDETSCASCSWPITRRRHLAHWDTGIRSHGARIRSDLAKSPCERPYRRPPWSSGYGGKPAARVRRSPSLLMTLRRHPVASVPCRIDTTGRAPIGDPTARPSSSAVSGRTHHSTRPSGSGAGRCREGARLGRAYRSVGGAVAEGPVLHEK